jgi:hypothetical protein
VTSNRELWDRLNEKQGQMFVAGGGFASEAILSDPAYPEDHRADEGAEPERHGWLLG